MICILSKPKDGTNTKVLQGRITERIGCERFIRIPVGKCQKAVGLLTVDVQWARAHDCKCPSSRPEFIPLGRECSDEKGGCLVAS